MNIDSKEGKKRAMREIVQRAKLHHRIARDVIKDQEDDPSFVQYHLGMRNGLLDAARVVKDWV